MKLLKKQIAMKEEASVIFKEPDYPKAITKFEECLELDALNGNFNSSLCMNISICHDKMGNKKEALKALNKALKFNPRYAKALVKRGDMKLAMEDFNEAIRDYSEASEHAPGEFNVQNKLKDAQAKAKSAKRKDYYKILGVSKDAQTPAISKAYKKMALKWHPDKHSNQDEETAAIAKKKFLDINEAHKVLTDRDMRDKYD